MKCPNCKKEMEHSKAFQYLVCWECKLIKYLDKEEQEGKDE